MSDHTHLPGVEPLGGEPPERAGEPLDPFERAVVFAIQEAVRLRRERRARMTVVEPQRDRQTA